MSHMIEEEPGVIIKNLLQAEWDATNIDGSFDASRRLSTGWWDEENPYTQITVSGMSEDRSPTGIDPGGGGFTSWADGTLDVNIWVPNDRDTTGGLHPKSHRWELDREVQRIFGRNSEGTTSDDGSPQLTRIESGESTYSVDDGDPVIFRARIRVGYQHHIRP